MRQHVAAALLVGAVAVAPVPQNAFLDRESGYRANNIGVALLEQYDYDGAAASFRKALAAVTDLSIARLNLAIALFYGNNPDGALKEAQTAAAALPASPQPQYVLGLIARAQDRSADAVGAFRKVLTIDPTDVGSMVNLGQVLTQVRKYPEAIPLFRDALAAEPYNVTAAYGLAIALTRSGAADEGRTAMQQFETLRGTAYARTYSQTYLEQGQYAEAIASTGAEADLVDTQPPAVTFTDATGVMLPNAPAAAPGAGSIVLFDADNDGDLDALDAGAGGVHFYRNTRGILSNATDAGLTSAAEGPASAALFGDYDNDGRADLLVLRAAGTRLLHQGSDGRFETAAAAALPPSSHASRSAAFLDADHDGDLDIFIAGDVRLKPDATTATNPRANPDAAAAPNQLLRNNGNGTFTDVTTEARVEGGGAAIAVVPTDFDNRRDIDILLVRRSGAPLLYQNVRDGSFRDAAKDAGLPGDQAYTAVASGDINKDGFPDFYFGRQIAAGIFAISNGRGRFTASDAPASTGAVAAQFIDYDDDGLLDLFVLEPARARLFRNLGNRWEDVTERAGLARGALQTAAASGVQAAASGDLDGDGDTDIIVRLATGALRVWRNDGGNRHPAVRVRLEGRVSNRAGVGSKVDIRAGSLRQRIETAAAVPSPAPADILFGLGSRSTADVVRVLWPSGTVQAETTLAVTSDGTGRTIVVTELNRKPSSCPYLYTWNGARFEFVTDFMGGGELGYWLAPGERAQPDPDEYVRITANQLQPVGGRYELRVTNELEEALFLDRVELVAVDHPQAVEVYPNEGLKPQPLPPFVLTTTRSARPPARAVDDRGHDVLPKLASIDRQYVDSFRVRQPRGYAERHTLTLDIGPAAENAVLLMTGWTDYAFSSDNVAAHQQGLTLQPPSLQVKDATGAWRTAIADIGIPVGRPQTIVVDLRGRLQGSRQVRIVTNMRIYWDQILVDTSGGDDPVRIARLGPSTAQLRWRGFSAEITPDGREPFLYDYTRVTTEMPWKIFPGRYTREGDVRELLRTADDMFVISRPGDEIALSFEASLPPVAQGWTRTFLLYADGFSKEMDINSASPHDAWPLPFHGMTRYPYGPGEHYPRTPQHLEYLSTYNTRVVHRELPPLEHGK